MQPVIVRKQFLEYNLNDCDKTFDLNSFVPFCNLMAKPSMYNYVGVGGVQGHTALRIVLLFVHKRITVITLHGSEGHI